MEAQGYEVKQGKFISFRAPGQERFTRCKTLGEDYTEERITQRIKGIAIDRGPSRRSAGEISLRIALEDSIKAQQSAGYARWAKLHNLKQAANSLNFITEHQIDSYEGLESRLARDQRGKRRGGLRPERRGTPPWGYGATDKKPLCLQAAPACGAGTAKRQRQGRVPAAA